METISVQPTSASYSVASIGDRVSAKLDGPASTVGRLQADTPQLVTLLWVVGFDDYETLRSVFRKNAARGNPPWQINLALLGENLPVAHIIKFVKNSIQFQSRGGITYNVSAKAYAISTHPIKLYPGKFEILYAYFDHDWYTVSPNSDYIYPSPQAAAAAAQLDYEAVWSQPHNSQPPAAAARGTYYAAPWVDFIKIGTVGDPDGFVAPYTYHRYYLHAQDYPPGFQSFAIGKVFGRFVPLN